MNNRDKTFIALSQDKDAKQISEELDITYSTVLRYRKEYEVAKKEGQLDAILSQDKLLIEQIANELPGDASQVIKNLEGLDKLSVSMQMSAELILTKLKIVVSNVGPDDVSDLAAAARLLCDLQNAFFNKNMINIQNNNFDSNAATYGEFLSDKPPIN